MNNKDDKTLNSNDIAKTQLNDNITKKKKLRRTRKTKEKNVFKNGSSNQQILGRLRSASPKKEDVVIGPPQSMNYPDIWMTEDMNFNDTVKVIKEEDVQTALTEKYAQVYSVSNSALSAELLSVLAPFNIVLCPDTAANEISSKLNQKNENRNQLIFVAEDEMTGLGRPLTECGKAISADDVVPTYQVKEILKSVMFDSKVMEKYALDIDQKFSDFVSDYSDADMTKVQSCNFIKWGSFCLSDQFNISSDDFKKIVDSDGLVQLSSLTLKVSDAGKVNFAAMYIYPFTSILSASKAAEGHREYEDYKNQPPVFEKPICRSDNMLNFEVNDSSPTECTYTFKNSLPKIDPTKSYIFKFADWKGNNQLHLPLKSDMINSEQLKFGLFQCEDDPCGSFYIIKTENPKDFVFFNRINKYRKYVHDKDVDNPIGNQLYISKLTAKYQHNVDVREMISIDCILINDQTLTNEDGSKKVWKVSIVPSDYDQNYGHLKIEEA